jgi:hypothetical protein
MKEFLQSRTVTKIMVFLGIVLAMLIVFQAGVVVGFHRGLFAGKWSQNYYRGLSGTNSIYSPFMRETKNPHGVVGEIISMSSSTFLVKGRDSAEEVVNITPTTTIRSLWNKASFDDFHNGTELVVIGEPDDAGEITASFIRILSPNPTTESVISPSPTITN